MALELLFAAGCLAQPIAADECRREWIRLEGTWERVSYLNEGRSLPAEAAVRFTLSLGRDGSYRLHVDERLIVEGKASIDPTQKPKIVDMTPQAGSSKGKPLLGIYELDGDIYRICYAHGGKPRPRSFSAEPGSGQVLIVYRRKKM